MKSTNVTRYAKTRRFSQYQFNQQHAKIAEYRSHHAYGFFDKIW